MKYDRIVTRSWSTDCLCCLPSEFGFGSYRIISLGHHNRNIRVLKLSSFRRTPGYAETSTPASLDGVLLLVKSQLALVRILRSPAQARTRTSYCSEYVGRYRPRWGSTTISSSFPYIHNPEWHGERCDRLSREALY